MTELFLTVVQMSITSSIIILTVLLIRLLLKKAPRKYSYLLWAVVAFRLVCPTSFESAFSLFSLPAGTEAAEGTGLNDIPSIDIREAIMEQKLSYLPNMDSSVEPFPTDHTYQWLDFQDKCVSVGSVIWAAGIVAILLYSIFSCLMLRRQLRTAIRLSERVWESDNVRSPFILGLIRPRIYIPFGLTEASLNYVLTHERCHLKRLDHIIKFAAYLILALHWFNPLVWLAFSLMSRDMEMSCDEKVLSKLSQTRQPPGTKVVSAEAAKSPSAETGVPSGSTATLAADYSTTLLSFAANRRFPAAGPLAFGETSVKQRIRHVLSWKKVRPWIAATAVIVCMAGAIVCSANPIPDGMIWAQNLKAEDIARIELVNIPDMDNLGYRIFPEENFQEIVDLINSSHGKHLPDPEIYYGGSSFFYVTLNDGTEHRIGVMAGHHLYIDGEAYAADRDWILAWDTLEITRSNAPFPEGFFQTGDSPYQSQKWAKALSEDEVRSIELQIWEDQSMLTERSLSKEEISAAVELVNVSRGKRLTSPNAPYGDWRIVLSIVTADGACHTIANCNNEYLIIDGDYYDASADWLQSWDIICGAGELPEGFSR